MEEEKLFDYARGLTAPYWIQEIRYKGKLIWYFSTPKQLSFFVVFGVVLFIMLTYFRPLMSFLMASTKSIAILLYWYLPYRAGKIYSEYQPQGKKMHIFIWDFLVYWYEFGINKKSIYQGERLDRSDLIVFEKTNL